MLKAVSLPVLIETGPAENIVSSSSADCIGTTHCMDAIGVSQYIRVYENPNAVNPLPAFQAAQTQFSISDNFEYRFTVDNPENFGIWATVSVLRILI